MRKRLEFRVVHDSGDSWNLLEEGQGPEEVVVVNTTSRGRDWLAATNYVKSMYASLSRKSCYKDVDRIEIWTAGMFGELLYSYGRNGEVFVDPVEDDEEVA